MQSTASEVTAWPLRVQWWGWRILRWHIHQSMVRTKYFTLGKVPAKSECNYKTLCYLRQGSRLRRPDLHRGSGFTSTVKAVGLCYDKSCELHYICEYVRVTGGSLFFLIRGRLEFAMSRISFDAAICTSSKTELKFPDHAPEICYISLFISWVFWGAV